MSSTPGPSSQPTRSLNRQVVLDEDEYTEALSHIIARDFFPHSSTSMPRTTIWTPCRHTTRSSSKHALADSLCCGAVRHTPAHAQGEGGEPSAKRARYDADMSLDAFQAKYTSEDNSSFTQILEDENRQRKEKYGWAWDAQRRVEEQRERMLEGRERLLLEAPSGAGVKERFRIEAPQPAGLIEAALLPSGSDKGKEKDTSALVKVEKRNAPDEVVDVMAPTKDTRPAGVDGWKFRARNALMFPPDADASPYNLLASQAAEDAKAPPKVVKHTNTRLPEQDDKPDHSISAPPSPTRSRIDAAIQGTPYRPKSLTDDLHSLVPSIPSPTPSELGPTGIKQLMTWGTLNATPRVLSQSNDPADMPTPTTPFRIAEPTSRERLSHKLSNDAAKSLRVKAGLLSGVPLLSRSSGSNGRRTSMPPPSWTPRKSEAPGSLTPAAKRLLDRTMGTAASRRADAMGRLAGWEGNSKERDLQKVRWTPTPSPVTRRG
ncbi:nuclear protein Es2-domain-containing protein [Fomes fomentarius]|nr:nuclear protein Es2-domain-containing protein [Fomes fomentarius]